MYDYVRQIPPGYYDAIFRRNEGVQSKWHHLKFSFVAHLLGDRVRRIVDVGCGPGSFSAVLPQTIQYTGLDLSPDQIDYATRTYGGATRHFFVSSDPPEIESGSVDAVSFIEVIEHLTREQTLHGFAQAMRWLRPGGMLILTTPNYRSLWPVLEYAVDRISPVKYEDQHINKYVRQRLRDDIRAAGFDDIRVGSFMLAGPFAAALSWNAADALDSFERKLGYLGFGSLLHATALKKS